MCKIFSGQDPNGYRLIHRSLRIDGHSTSMRLEAAFWDLLEEMAQKENLSTAKFIATLFDEATQQNGEIPYFASMLRTTCLLYLRASRPDVDGRADGKLVAA